MVVADPRPLQPPQEQKETAAMHEEPQNGTIDPDDPLLIAQTLTYVTDNGSIVMSYSSAPFSTGTPVDAYFPVLRIALVQSEPLYIFQITSLIL